MKMIDDTRIRLRLIKHISDTYISKKDAAKSWGVCSSMVDKMISGKSSIPSSILDEMGYEKVDFVNYQKK